MKSIAVISLLVSLTFAGKAQNSSLLYNEKRQLKADTNLVLTEEAYKVWLEFEKSTLHRLIDCYKPAQIFHENGVKTSCIFSITIDPQSDNAEIAVVKVLTNDETARKLTKALIYPVQECVDENMRIVRVLKHSVSRMVFYVPLAAPIDPIEKWVDENGVLNIDIPELPTYIVE